MQQKFNRRSAVVGLVMAAAVLGASCGGGGSSAPGDDPGAGGPGTGGTGGGASGPTGTLWHNNYPLDYKDGTQTASLDGAEPVYVTSDKSATPWPDGSQYAVSEYDNYENRTYVTVYDTETDDTLYDYSFYGYVRYIRPSPVSKGMFVAVQSDDYLLPTDNIFVDLDAGKIVQRVDGNKGAMNWMPDGRYVLVSDDTGKITASAVNGTSTQLGQIDIPDGHTLGPVSVNRQGTKIALELMDEDDDGFLESDMWVSSIDGSALTQFTDTGMTGYAIWSPDGNYLAFDVDTGHWANSGGFSGGTCELWYAPATSKMVKALPSSGDAFGLMVKDESMSDESLGCDLIAWVP